MPGHVNKAAPAYIRSSADARRAFADVKKRLEAELNRIKGLSGDAAEAIGQKIFDRSQYLVPVSAPPTKPSVFHGALKASGQIVREDGVNFTRVTISYGNADVQYAVYVHEILQNKHVAPTQAKFLQEPAFAEIATLAQDVSKYVREH